MLQLKQIMIGFFVMNALFIILFFNASVFESPSPVVPTPFSRDNLITGDETTPEENKKKAVLINSDMAALVEKKLSGNTPKDSGDQGTNDSPVNYIGKASEKMSKEAADELNMKIHSNPQLIELVNNFHKLKLYSQELAGRYKKLKAENNQLREQTKTLKNQKKPFVTPTPAAPVRPAVVAQNKVAPANQVKSQEVRNKQAQTMLRYSNPFYLLGAYPQINLTYFNSYPDGRPFYDRFNYGLQNDPDYCELVDFYNLAHPENIFSRKTFFTDYAKNGLPRKSVMRKIGYDLSVNVSKYMPKRLFRSRMFHLDPRINMFFSKRIDLHIYHEIGKHFLCATQMYNHIPGHGVLKRKDMIVDSVDAYALENINRPKCFNKGKFFPFSYRLYNKDECLTFFKEINSQEYKQKLETEPIKYLVKVGYGSHRAEGVFLMDQQKTLDLKTQYQNGAACGTVTKSLIAQTYIPNPLLLNYNNKFDFRVYMLVASTNPLIVYYHDGFLRVSLHSYDKFSSDRSTHLTNTHLSKGIFSQVKKENTTLHGMSEEELRDYQMWTFDQLQDYLLKSGKIKSKNWLSNYLRPKFKEAFIHIVKMTQHAFWKESNVFELFGLDFMLDDQLNLWFLECNSSPQFVGTNEHKTKFLIQMLRDMFEIQYAYYKSRMSRILSLLKRLEEEGVKVGEINYQKFQKDYAEAARNKIEPKYAISPNNTFELIMDLSKKGSAAYFGNLNKECFN